MSLSSPLHAFSAYGVELEYAIVDTPGLAVKPIAEFFLDRIRTAPSKSRDAAHLDWSNELVAHVVELKNTQPTPDLNTLNSAMQAEIDAANDVLDPMDARLMPTAMHPQM